MNKAAFSRRGATWTVLALFLTIALVAFGPVAFAHHKSDHGNGGGGSTEVTEDNDDDRVSNTPDPEGDSDNRHPSGKDKHAEGGNSGNQGKAQADPDGDSNGGVDQPGGSGGDDELDQDGNNGCGNDDDFEDDNNGRCLGRQGGDDDDEDAVGGQVFVSVCHKAGDRWTVLTIAEAALEAHLGHGDIYPVPEGAPESCASDDVVGGETFVSVCHSTGAGWMVLSILEADLDDHLAHGDIFPVPEGAPATCETGGGDEENGDVGGDDVLGTIQKRVPTEKGDAVLGLRFGARGVAAGRAEGQGGALPFTGAALFLYFALSLALLGIGSLVVKLTTKRTQ